jgi:hypothetical protein
MVTEITGCIAAREVKVCSYTRTISGLHSTGNLVLKIWFTSTVLVLKILLTDEEMLFSKCNKGHM